MELYTHHGSFIKISNPILTSPALSNYYSGFKNLSSTFFLFFFSFLFVIFLHILSRVSSSKHDAKRRKSFQSFNSQLMILLTLSLSLTNLDLSKGTLINKLKFYFSMLLRSTQQFSVELVNRSSYTIFKWIRIDSFRNETTSSNMCCYNTQGKTGKYKINKIIVSLDESSQSSTKINDYVFDEESMLKQNDNEIKHCLRNKVEETKKCTYKPQRKISTFYGVIFFILFFVSPTDALTKSNSSSTKSEGTQTVMEEEILTNVVVAVTAACLTVFVIILIAVCILCLYKNCYHEKYTEDSLTKPFYNDSAYVPIFLERNMAQSAQMFFYQFQKQQLIAQEREQQSKRKSVDSMSDSDNEKGNTEASMISCPGLAMNNGEDIEVRNPLFPDDISASPGWATTTPHHQSTNESSAEETLGKNNDVDDDIVLSPPPPSVSPISRPPSSTRNNTPASMLTGMKTPDDLSMDMMADDNNNKIPLGSVIEPNDKSTVE